MRHDHRGGNGMLAELPMRAAISTCARAPRDCGALPFTIRRDGTWLYQGSPIRRKEMVCLFASVLKRAPDGGYLLETPVERGRIQVEDAPFVAVEMFVAEGCAAERWHDQRISFRTNCEHVVTAGPGHPIRVAHDLITCEPTPYVLVREGLEARISRPVYYELVALATEEVVNGARMLGVWSRGCFFPLGDVPDAHS
jgi:hypothetical protein